MQDFIQSLHDVHVKKEHMQQGCTLFTETCPFCETYVREQRPSLEEKLKDQIQDTIKWHVPETTSIVQDGIADRIAQLVVRTMYAQNAYREEPVGDLSTHPIVLRLWGNH